MTTKLDVNEPVPVTLTFDEWAYVSAFLLNAKNTDAYILHSAIRDQVVAYGEENPHA